ncbi:MAG TPA: ATP-dependent DNA helicase RecG [Thermoanaerobaculia bacterium]
MQSGLDLDTPLSALRGVGSARARALAEAGYSTIRDLLFHLPQRYEDRRETQPVSAAAAGAAFTFRGRLTGLRRVYTRRRGFTIVRGFLEDATGRLAVIWLNRPYLMNQVEEGQEYVLHGQVREAKGGLELLNPSCERAGVHGARIVPVYGAAGGVGPAAVDQILAAVLERIDLLGIPETLPDELLERHGLPRLGESLQAVHHPREDADVEALNERSTPEQQRLIYGELLDLQVRLALLREKEKGEPRRRRYRIDAKLRRALAKIPPFPLTAAQERVVEEILADLEAGHPMRRLLQGDVGSGKTIVAALALAAAMESGFQGAFMAPTELLAEQHYANLERLLGSRYRLVLLTGSAAEAGRRRDLLASGEAQLAVGTHALIQETVEFQRLGLAAIDEQHRFGVAQRALLRQKGDRPDLLVMTATPIPRSLALTAYGDLPVSTLDELPPGRSPVRTEVVPARRRQEIYARLREAVEAGARSYVVAPLIEESGRLNAASLEEVKKQVRESLPGSPIAVLHGRIPAADRERTMRAFAAGEVRVLVATTVIEVGVDVPEATWMIIESAERFGLAQLHQLRGRVGRSAAQATCVALHGRLSETARRRLEVFASTNDGFVIAEEDLALRGPGDLMGTRQAGLPTLRAARLPEDWDWLVRARDDAKELLGRLDEAALKALGKAVEEVEA